MTYRNINEIPFKKGDVVVVVENNYKSRHPEKADRLLKAGEEIEILDFASIGDYQGLFNCIVYSVSYRSSTECNLTFAHWSNSNFIPIKDVKAKTQEECTCELMNLMQRGCTCGQMEREKCAQK